MDKIAEILYHAYELATLGEDLSPEGYSETFKKLSKSLNKKQQNLLREFDFLNLELLIAHETRAIRYVLELVQPELVQ